MQNHYTYKKHEDLKLYGEKTLNRHEDEKCRIMWQKFKSSHNKKIVQ